MILNVLRLLTFGGLRIESDDGTATPRLSPPRLALLAVLAAAGDRGLSRERLVALFWPDSDEPRARHSLRQVLYAVQNDIGREVIRSTNGTLALDLSTVGADVADFYASLSTGNRQRAVELAREPFLDGFYLAGAPEFERWVEEERARLAEATTTALLSLATDATRVDDHETAMAWWRRLTVADPLSGRFALGYLRALAAGGHRADALAFARQHEAIVKRDLDSSPDPDVVRLEAALRAMPKPGYTTPIGAVADTSPPQGDQSSPVVRHVAPPRPDVESLDKRGKAPTARVGSMGKVAVTVAALLALAMATAWARGRAWLGSSESPPALAVGFIREEGVPDSLRHGGVLTDMLATNLARVNGLAVLANSRLLELLRPGQDSSVGYADAARRAGAAELLEGRLLTTPHAVLALEMRRVDLRTGIVKEVYEVSALDRSALVDSLTQAVARRFRLTAPGGSVTEVTTASPVAYRLYEEGLRMYLNADMKSAQQFMHAALEEDSTFAMAAYYETVLATAGGQTMPDGRHIADVRRNAIRLAERAPERERLMITSTLLQDDMEPRGLAVAESLALKYPLDPRARATLGQARTALGDWRGAVEEFERAIAIDSLAEPTTESNCRFCQDLGQLADAYLWWDSLPAAERTAHRLIRARPTAPGPQWLLAVTRARLGDSTSAYEAFRRFRSRGAGDASWKLGLDLMLENYDALEREVRPYLASSYPAEWSNGAWSLLIALRNQGRLREAFQLHRTGSLPGFPALAVTRSPDDITEGILAFERGDGRASAAVFARRLRNDMSRWAPGYRARHLAWNGTLEAMALAAVNDTAALRLLADSVERWGEGSSYGRDRKAHHYIRGLVLAGEGRHREAAGEFLAAIHSPSLGFTRVNYELARCLLKLDRPREAVATLQSALRSTTDASNLYITRTDVHELLAESFDRAGLPDSAAHHYRAVVRAWRRADPEFHERRARAVTWLAR